MTHDFPADLGKPEAARDYIARFHFEGKKPTWIELSDGRRIDFATMTDDDAVLVAHALFNAEVHTSRNITAHLRQHGLLH